jgi:3-isopropylmalate/(R)-2-methylmalate dehydratase large subunit
MAMTMTQKILARHAGMDHIEAGDFIEANLDGVLGNDITTPVAINILEERNIEKIEAADKTILVMDHFIPNKDIKSAMNCQMVRNFAKTKKIDKYYDVGDMGIEHCLLPEKGLVVSGDAVIGADSHTCTYGALGAFSTGVGSTDMAAAMATGKAWFRVPEAIRFELKGKMPRYVSGKDVILSIIGDIGVDGALYQSMEFGGEGMKNLSMADRFTIANMAIEAGAKNGIFEVDEATMAYQNGRGVRSPEIYKADKDAAYARIIEIDLGAVEPLVAFPHLPSNIKRFGEFNPVILDQVVIGSCTNGRLEDLRKAAGIMKGKRAAKGTRTIIIPGTQQIYLDALREGLIEIFVEAGAIVSTPTCGPCLGGYMGILAKGERALSTTNRNFVGRMGHPESEVYLSSPEVAAASAIMGRIVHPEEVSK